MAYILKEGRSIALTSISTFTILYRLPASPEATQAVRIFAEAAYLK